MTKKSSEFRNALNDGYIYGYLKGKIPMAEHTPVSGVPEVCGFYLRNQSELEAIAGKCVVLLIPGDDLEEERNYSREFIDAFAKEFKSSENLMNNLYTDIGLGSYVPKHNLGLFQSLPYWLAFETKPYQTFAQALRKLNPEEVSPVAESHSESLFYDEPPWA